MFSEMRNLVLNPPVPYIGFIPGGFSPGKAVRIRGMVSHAAYGFDVILQCGPNIIDDIAVQVAVQVVDGYVSVNSFESGSWGEEERGALPIKRAEKFEIILACEINQYKVVINGLHYCMFPQNVHYDRISHLAIEGDASLIQISYEVNADPNDLLSTTSQSGATEPSAPISGCSPPSYGRALATLEQEEQFSQTSKSEPQQSVWYPIYYTSNPHVLDGLDPPPIDVSSTNLVVREESRQDPYPSSSPCTLNLHSYPLNPLTNAYLKLNPASPPKHPNPTRLSFLCPPNQNNYSSGYPPINHPHAPVTLHISPPCLNIPNSENNSLNNSPRLSVQSTVALNSCPSRVLPYRSFNSGRSRMALQTRPKLWVAGFAVFTVVIFITMVCVFVIVL